MYSSVSSGRRSQKKSGVSKISERRCTLYRCASSRPISCLRWVCGMVTRPEEASSAGRVCVCAINTCAVAAAAGRI